MLDILPPGRQTALEKSYLSIESYDSRHSIDNLQRIIRMPARTAVFWSQLHPVFAVDYCAYVSTTGRFGRLF